MSLHCLQIAIELVLGLDRAWLNPERLEELRGLFGDWLEGFTSPFALDVSWTGSVPLFIFASLWVQHASCACMHLLHHACTSPLAGLHRGAAAVLEGAQLLTCFQQRCGAQLCREVGCHRPVFLAMLF